MLSSLFRDVAKFVRTGFQMRLLSSNTPAKVLTADEKSLIAGELNNVYSTVLREAKVFRPCFYKYEHLQEKVPVKTLQEFYWKASDKKVITVNVDGGFDKRKKVGGVGCVACDEKCKVRYWSALRMKNTRLALVERKTSLIGKQLIRELRDNVEVRGDSKSFSKKFSYKPDAWMAYEKLSLYMERVRDLPPKYSLVLKLSLVDPASIDFTHFTAASEVEEFSFAPESIVQTMDLGEICTDHCILRTEIKSVEARDEGTFERWSCPDPWIF